MAQASNDEERLRAQANDEEHSRAEAIERKIITAKIVHDAVRLEGEEELSRSNSSLAWSGIAAGLAMGFSLIAEGSLQSRLEPEAWRPLVTKFGYSIGFVIVTLGRQQLFTENTLTAVIPALERKSLAAWADTLRLWAIVLAANLVGALAIAWFVGTDAFAPEARQAFAEIGHHATSGSSWTIFLKAIPAGWLIALIVWLGPAIPSARLWIVLLLSYVVGIGEFSHIIAGSVEALHLVTIGELTWWSYASGYFLPTLVGNTLGGVLLVAVLNHAQAER